MSQVTLAGAPARHVSDYHHGLSSRLRLSFILHRLWGERLATVELLYVWYVWVWRGSRGVVVVVMVIDTALVRTLLSGGASRTLQSAECMHALRRSQRAQPPDQWMAQRPARGEGHVTPVGVAVRVASPWTIRHPAERASRLVRRAPTSWSYICTYGLQHTRRLYLQRSERRRLRTPYRLHLR